MIEVRTEKPEDLAGIREVHLQAFDPSPNEARLVELLREAGKAPISLVAVSDGQIVGHVLFSPGTIDPAPPGPLRGLGLAPIGVLPAFQKQGVGTKLIVQGLRDCERGGYDFVVVLGDPRYYLRFGFARAKTYELGNEYGADEAFRVFELRTSALQGVEGTVKDGPEFQEAGC